MLAKLKKKVNMRFGLTKDHHDFFHRHHYIEFEDLLTATEVEILKQGIEETLTKRLSHPKKTLKNVDLKKLYHAGYDGWRDNDQIKKVALRSTLGEIAADLSKVRPLRIAFDQIIYASSEPTKLFQKNLSLRELSGIKKIACGLILHLSPSSIPVEQETLTTKEDETALIPLPKRAGSGIFFSPELPLSLDYLTEMPDISQLLIVYAEEKCLYTHEPNDPHNHALKRLDYVFGDRLRSTTHPIVF